MSWRISLEKKNIKSKVSLNYISERSDLCENTRACLDPQIKITAILLLL